MIRMRQSLHLSTSVAETPCCLGGFCIEVYIALDVIERHEHESCFFRRSTTNELVRSTGLVSFPAAPRSLEIRWSH